jgi:hypothetical protein
VRRLSCWCQGRRAVAGVWLLIEQEVASRVVAMELEERVEASGRRSSAAPVVANRHEESPMQTVIVTHANVEGTHTRGKMRFTAYM